MISVLANDRASHRVRRPRGALGRELAEQEEILEAAARLIEAPRNYRGIHALRGDSLELVAREVIREERKRFERLSFAHSNWFGRRIDSDAAAVSTRTAVASAIEHARTVLNLGTVEVCWFRECSSAEYLRDQSVAAQEFIASAAPIVGRAQRGSRAIWIAADLAPAEAADTVLHECRHLWQFINRPAIGKAESERDASDWARLHLQHVGPYGRNRP